MRSTLLASCLLGLSFAVVGCDDAKMAEDTTPPPVVAPAPAEPGKGAMEGPGGAMSGPTAEPTVAPAPTEPGKGAMEGTEAAPVAPTTPETKTEEMPK